MDIEILIVYSSILSAMFYTAVRTCKPIPFVISPPDHMESKDENDFMVTNAIPIELMALVFTPACMGSIYKAVVSVD